MTRRNIDLHYIEWPISISTLVGIILQVGVTVLQNE